MKEKILSLYHHAKEKMAFIPSTSVTPSNHSMPSKHNISLANITLLGALLLLLIAIANISTIQSTSSRVGDRDLPIYCVQTDKPQIALSFDAAWGNEDTKKILSILENHNVKVTFFLTGGWVDTYPEDVKAIYAAGHDIGNHSEHHKDMATLATDQQKEELMQVHNKVKELTGYDMFLFRPPYGSYNNNLMSTTKECGYYTIQWDVDSLDWKNYDADTILKKVTQHKHLGNGSIILCHNGGKHTAEALDSLITTLEEQGYELVPISQLIIKDHYHMNSEGRQCED